MNTGKAAKDFFLPLVLFSVLKIWVNVEASLTLLSPLAPFSAVLNCTSLRRAARPDDGETNSQRVTSKRSATTGLRETLFCVIFTSSSDIYLCSCKSMTRRACSFVYVRFRLITFCVSLRLRRSLAAQC
jgi:hypothetical protein